MRSPSLASLFLLVALAATSIRSIAQEPAAPTPPPLLGKISGNTYTPPNGAYQVELPVLPELGGSVMDTENVVTFQDAFNVHASIACFPMDAYLRWENETQGRRDYLVWFFTNYVEADFVQRFPGAKIESAVFIPSLNDGSVLAYNLLPGGSMFSARLMLGTEESPPVAKRGNLLFVHGEFAYILSIELAEKVLERTSYKLTIEEENALLRKRLMDLLAKIKFPTPPKPTPSKA